MTRRLAGSRAAIGSPDTRPVGDEELHDRLLRFEAALAARDPGGVEGGLMSLIAEDFVEFGRSGRVWTRDSIGELLEGPPGAPVEIDRFGVAPLGSAVVLVTYRASNANRSSVWVRRDGRWQLRFHQGTPTDDRRRALSGSSVEPAGTNTNAPEEMVDAG